MYKALGLVLYVAFFLANLFAFSAALCATEDAPNAKLRIRIFNDSLVPLNDITVNFPSQIERFGSLPPGIASEYREVAWAYRYAPISVSIFGSKYEIATIDYIGEIRLPPRQYTITLDLDGQSLTMELAEDSP